MKWLSIIIYIILLLENRVVLTAELNVSKFRLHSFHRSESLRRKSLVSREENIELKSYGAVYKDENGKFVLSSKKLDDKSKSLVAECFFNKVINEKGWDKISINTYKTAKPFQQAFLAGYLEGRMTSDDIFNFYNNLKVNHSIYHKASFDKMNEFFANVAIELSKKIKSIKENFEKMNYKEKKLWSRLILGYSQLEGLIKGYNYEIKRTNQFKEKKLTAADFLIIQADGEVPELLKYFGAQTAIKKNVKVGDDNYFKEAFGIDTKDPMTFWGQLMWTSKCSAFIKITADKDGKWKDLLGGHTTWTEYYELLRTYKHYNFELSDKKGIFKKNEITFSSYPGCLSSTDDFFLTTNNLLVMETTLEVVDINLYKNVKKPEEYIPNFMRVLAATRFAKSAKKWVSYFSKNNSGTYSSQWMIIDYNVFAKIHNTNKKLPNLLFMMEQTPDKIESHDISDYLYKNKYFGSFNRAFLDETKNDLNVALIKNLYGERFDYNGAKRAIIFKKMNESVNDIKTLKDILRYNGYKLNNFEGDPSTKNPGEGISSRYDLDNNGLGNLSGGIDCKVTNFEYSKALTAIAISGPTNENNKNLSTFSWKSSSKPETKRDGVPDSFDFPYIIMSPKTLCCDNKNDVFIFK